MEDVSFRVTMSQRTRSTRSQQSQRGSQSSGKTAPQKKSASSSSSSQSSQSSASNRATAGKKSVTEELSSSSEDDTTPGPEVNLEEENRILRAIALWAAQEEVNWLLEAIYNNVCVLFIQYFPFYHCKKPPKCSSFLSS